MKRLRFYLEDILFQSGKPCVRYLPHFKPHKYIHMRIGSHPLNEDHNYYLDQMRAAIDCLFAEESEEDIVYCIWQISSLNTQLIRFASRRLYMYWNEKQGRKVK